MLLAIDVGNTETVIGLYARRHRDGARRRGRASASASAPSTPDAPRG